MESEILPPAQNFKITCFNYPEEFDIDKSLCKSYFRQYGRVKRVIFKQRQHVIVVEYTDETHYLKALQNAGEYNGHTFLVEPFESKASQTPNQDQIFLTKKKSRDKIVSKRRVVYIDKDEVRKELDAMSGYSNIKDIVDLTQDDVAPITKPKKAPKLNRVWMKEDLPFQQIKEKPKKVSNRKKLIETVIKKKVKEKFKMLTAEQLELLKIIKSQAHTVEDKFKILDARDKLLRLKTRKTNLKTGPTVGTCPDMCPEKERLLREMKHQIHLYEQDDAGRHSMAAEKAVKQYSRSSADQETPLPHELRPVSVLQLTMNYLVHMIMIMCDTDPDVNIGEWYHFLWDRTRGIRKDITQQALCCKGAVDLVEQCARFHIHCSARLTGEEPSIFDQKINTENLTKCLQTLKYMYKDLELKGEQCPNEAEFRAYVILLNLNDGNFMWEVQELRQEIQKSPEIKFALQIYSAFEKHNYVKFFKLIKSTTYLKACILMRYFIQVRIQALETLIKCFTPPKSISFYPLQELVDLLYFDDIETTVDFLTTYGLSVNKERNYVMIERSSFKVPEYSYVLERSSNIENKKQETIGTIVCGNKLSPEIYMEIQSRTIHSSFDKDGFLIHDDLFEEIELKIEERLLDEPDSRESTPERKNTTNVPQKVQPSTNLKHRKSNPFGQPKEENIFSQNKIEPDNIFAQNKIDATNIFKQNKITTTTTKTELDIFNQNKSEPGNIFNQVQSEPMQQNKLETNIFDTSSKKEFNIFKPKKENIFSLGSAVPQENTLGAMLVAKNFKTDAGNIFAQKSSVTDEISEVDAAVKPYPSTVEENKESKNIFDQNVDNKISKHEPPEIGAKKGGFTFIFNKSQKSSEVPNIFAPGFIPSIDDHKKKEQEEAEKKKQELLLMASKMEEEKAEQRKKEEESRKKNEELRRINEEAAERRRIEIERTKEEEIERKKQEERERVQREKRLQEEEMKRKQEELDRQKKALEEQKHMEIQNTVKSVVTKMIEIVDLKIKDEKLFAIRQNMKRRTLVKICKKWRYNVLKKKKKRKAMDCNPTWMNMQNVEQCAKELHSKSQDLTLRYMKRYKYGHPLDIPLIKEPSPGKINLFLLTYSSLRRRLCQVKEKWHQHIYWKVVISIPDIDEMINGLHKLEEILKTYINWELNKYGHTLYIEEHKTITYCIEKQQGLEVKNSDANAFIFVAKNFNSLLQKRIFENLKNVGVYVKIPLVLILEDATQAEEYLTNLQESGIVSDYVIYSCNLSGQVLLSIINHGLIFLSKKVEKFPPIEMDTLYSFLLKNLCTEMWKKAESYAKWNHEYNFCMRNPNTVINLYNQGLDLLTNIIMDKKCKEYNSFPEVFKDYLPDRIPDFLPCDYRYFPSFWNQPTYESHLLSILKNLKLPKFLEYWPAQNETDLLLGVSKYCTDIFKNPKQPYISILNVLKDGVIDEHFDKILWTKAIQIIAVEKLKEQDLTLPKRLFDDSVFKTFIVVYDIEALNKYNNSEWFYRNNPVIEGFKKTIIHKVEEDIKENSRIHKKRALDISLGSEDILKVINKAENILKSPKQLCLETKTQMDHIHQSLLDLEDSIKVVKRMDEMNLLKRFLDN